MTDREKAAELQAAIRTIGQYVAKTCQQDGPEWQAMNTIWAALGERQERGAEVTPEDRATLQADDVLRLVGKAGNCTKRDLRQRIQGLAAFRYDTDPDKGKLLNVALARLAAGGRITVVNELVTIC